MNDFTKLILFLGQQYYLYNRRIIFTEELRQIFPEEKIIEVLAEPLSQGWLKLAGDEFHFEITELAEATLLRHWEKNIYQTGEIGGGSMSIDPNDHRFTMLVIFDTPVKFVEHKVINYCGKEIHLNCVDGFYYEAKIYTSSESEFKPAEEAINRYLSHLSYHYKIPISIRSIHSGSINITNTTKKLEPRTGVYLQLPELPTLEKNQFRAAAFYRQFRNFSQFQTTEARYYQVISLLKIMEGVNPSANPSRNKSDFIGLIDKNLPNLSQELQAIVKGIEVKYAINHGPSLPFNEILWEHYRNGVAHWRARGNFLDPDEPDDTIGSTIRVLEQLALMVLTSEFGL